ncbi:hypothetical protein BD779DRAFT_1124164 [Infundibulicybe gibba]|nr:hypothetical protein BD779DRAFT_1124164 [Infundibulicybe gibba]
MPSTLDHPPPDLNFIKSESNLGAMEIATFISLALCGIAVAQGYSYYHHFTNDRPFLKVMVGTVLALEVAHSIATAHAIYNFTITLAAAAVTPADTNALSVAVLLETLITAIVQTFFAYRIRSLSGNLYISSLCWVLSFLRFLSGIALTIENFLDIPLLSVGAAVDLIIAASLCYYLNRLMSPVTLKRTAQIVDRLISWTIHGSGDKVLGATQSQGNYVLIMNQHGVSRYSHLLPGDEGKLRVYSRDRYHMLTRLITGGVWMAIYTVLAKLYSNSLLLSSVCTRVLNFTYRMIVRLNVRMVNQAPLTTGKSDTLEFVIPVTQPGSDGSHVHHIPVDSSAESLWQRHSPKNPGHALC